MLTIKNSYFFLSLKRKKAYLLLIMILIMALLDILGVASIMPFVAVLSNPDIVETNLMLNKFFKFSKNFGVTTVNEFLFMLGMSVFLFLLASLTFRALTHYTQARFLGMRQHSLGKRLLEGYLHQPYSWFLSRNSAEVGKTIFSEVSKVVGKGLSPLLELITQGAVTIALITLLILVDPKLTLIIGLTLSVAYILIFNFTQKLVSRMGKKHQI